MVEIYKIQNSYKKYLYDSKVQFEKQWKYLTQRGFLVDTTIAYKLDTNMNWQEIRKKEPV